MGSPHFNDVSRKWGRVHGKETDLIDGFTSKAGKPFSAKLALQDGKVTFVFPPRN